MILSWKLVHDDYSKHLEPELEAISSTLRENHPPVGFTDDLLRDIRKRAPVFRNFVFRHPGVSEAFIRESFEEEFVKDTRGDNSSAIRDMIDAANMPDDLLLRIANSPSRSASTARLILNARHASGHPAR